MHAPESRNTAGTLLEPRWNLAGTSLLAILETCNCGILEPCKTLEPCLITLQSWVNSVCILLSTVGFQYLGLGVVRRFLSALKTGTEPWNSGTCCWVLLGTAELQSWVNYINCIPRLNIFNRFWMFLVARCSQESLYRHPAGSAAPHTSPCQGKIVCPMMRRARWTHTSASRRGTAAPFVLHLKFRYQSQSAMWLKTMFKLFTKFVLNAWKTSEQHSSVTLSVTLCSGM